MLYFATHTMAVDAGVMITASHNPKEYNGLKICLGTQAVWGPEIQEIKRLYEMRASPVASVRGSYTQYDILPAYIKWLHEQFSSLHNIAMPMLFDCGNGVAGVVMPHLISLFGWSQAQLLYATPDGTFPHHPADPSDAHTMHDLWHAMQKDKIMIGIGFDGDADRMGALDDQGDLIFGDQLLAIFAQYMLRSTPALRVVWDITASAGLTSFIEAHGGSSIIAPCGTGSIKRYMKEHGALLGGELSCHFFFMDKHFGFDDGIYAALRLLEIVHNTGKSLHALRSVFPKKISSPQYRIACAEADKKRLVQVVQDRFMHDSAAQLLTIDGVRVSLPYGYGLIRASNTQPVLVFRFESDTIEQLRGIQRLFADTLAPVFATDLYQTFGL
jgi:phosphomannomutase/phosphoglucomutase